MCDLFVTRFTEETRAENNAYCSKKIAPNVKKIIYNSPIRISKNVPYNTDIIVLEMNNTKNKIMGVSQVKNRIIGTHTHKMYMDNNYNRYSYVGRDRISIDEMNEGEQQVMRFLEDMCFKGKTHIKRGQGMSKINDKMFLNCRELLDVPLFVKKMFMRRRPKHVLVKLNKGINMALDCCSDSDIATRHDTHTRMNLQ